MGWGCAEEETRDFKVQPREALSSPGVLGLWGGMKRYEEKEKD